MEQWDIYDRERRLTGRTMKKNDWTMKNPSGSTIRTTPEIR